VETKSLIRAAESHEQVAVSVEIKARFDKAALVVRREVDG
jgi:polyphosphate kinase